VYIYTALVENNHFPLYTLERNHGIIMPNIIRRTAQRNLPLLQPPLLLV
jgi:hypothetical protein